MQTNLIKSSQGGQILLVVVLAAVISLTVGLSAIGRTITNTKVAVQETNSQRALSAAEAGVEKILNSATKTSVDGRLTESNFNATSTPLSGAGPFVMNCSDQVNSDNCWIDQDDGADIWLSNPTTFGNQWPDTGTEPLTIYWIDNPSPNCVAIEVSLLSGSSRNNPTLTRYAYDSCATSRGNNFQIPSQGTFRILGKDYNRRITINVTNGFIARVIPIYGNTRIAVSGNGLPSQGSIIESTGTSGKTSRKIKVFKGYPKIPIEFFPYNLFIP